MFNRLPRPACIGDAEVGVGVQDELLARPANIPYLRHARVEGRDPVDGFGLPRPVGAISITRRLARKLHAYWAVVVVIGDLLARQARGHIAVGVIAQRVAAGIGGGVRAWGEAAGVGVSAHRAVAAHIAARVIGIGHGGVLRAHGVGKEQTAGVVVFIVIALARLRAVIGGDAPRRVSGVEDVEQVVLLQKKTVSNNEEIETAII